jgi:hypothetical protein
MTESTALTTLQPAQAQPGALAFLHDGAALDHLYRVAKCFSMSGLVPGHFQGKPEACMIALMYAEQLGEHPMLLFQELSVINGRPNTSARFAISRANKSGLLQGPITWKSKGQGEALEVTASAVLRETGEVISTTVTMKEAAADGWTRNPKYRSIPEQMLRWRAATRLINLYMPEVLFGLGVREEAEVRPVAVREQPSEGGTVVADLNRQIAAAAAGQTAAVSEPEIVNPEPMQEQSPAVDSAADVEVVDAPVDPF